MKKHERFFLYSLLLMVLFSSCTVYELIPIEVIRSREVPLSLEGKQIALLYRNFKYQGDTLQQYYLDRGQLREDKENPEQNFDSIVVSSCLQSVAQAFAGYGVGSVPMIYPVDMMPGVKGEKFSPLPSSLIRKIIQPSKADYLVSLETLSYFYSRSVALYSLGGDGAETNESRQVVMAGIWAVYDGHSGEVVDSRQMADTLYWNETDEAISGRSALPPRLPALQLAAEVFGENYADKFYSDWIQVTRTLIIPPLEEFRLAADYAGEQKWDRASAIWERYADDHFGKLAISARYNLALAAEINDDLVLAEEHIIKAYELASVYRNKNELKMVLLYRDILQNRLKEINRIKQTETQ